MTSGSGRDYLSGENYHENMHELMMKKFDIVCKQSLWISEEELKKIKNDGHVVGLHSLHQLRISENLSEQEYEYKQNRMYLTKILGKQ